MNGKDEGLDKSHAQRGLELTSNQAEENASDAQKECRIGSYEEFEGQASIKNYWLPRDRQKKRVSKAIKRLDYADIMAYVFAAVHNLYQEEPSIYKETIESQ